MLVLCIGFGLVCCVCFVLVIVALFWFQLVCLVLIVYVLCWVDVFVLSGCSGLVRADLFWSCLFGLAWSGLRCFVCCVLLGAGVAVMSACSALVCSGLCWCCCVLLGLVKFAVFRLVCVLFGGDLVVLPVCC